MKFRPLIFLFFFTFQNSFYQWYNLGLNDKSITEIKAEISIQIYSQDGILLKSNNIGSGNLYSLNVSKYPPGIYYYTIESIRQKISGKFLKVE